MEIVRDTLPDDAIITNGAGNYAGWVHRYYRFRKPGTQLAPTSGAMGYGLPAAVAAKLKDSNRVVVSFSGDGCFQMNCQEIGTAMQYGAKVLFIVVNNSMYGTIRVHQEKRFPGRISGTDIVNPNFPAICEAYGGKGFLVKTTEQFEGALTEALKGDHMALIEIQIDPDDISPGLKLSAING